MDLEQEVEKEVEVKDEKTGKIEKRKQLVWVAVALETVLKGPYLGMKPPGDVPELFAPGIVSSVYLEHSSAVFTPDGKYLFFVGYSEPYNEKDIIEKKYSYSKLIAIQESMMNGLGNIYWVNTSFIDKLKPTN